MGTNANLPAGFTITTIGGIRCTAVPRALTTFVGLTDLGTTATAVATSASSPPPSSSSAAISTSASSAAASSSTSVAIASSPSASPVPASTSQTTTDASSVNAAVSAQGTSTSTPQDSSAPTSVPGATSAAGSSLATVPEPVSLVASSASASASSSSSSLPSASPSLPSTSASPSLPSASSSSPLPSASPSTIASPILVSSASQASPSEVSGTPIALPSSVISAASVITSSEVPSSSTTTTPSSSISTQPSSSSDFSTTQLTSHFTSTSTAIVGPQSELSGNFSSSQFTTSQSSQTSTSVFTSASPTNTALADGILSKNDSSIAPMVGGIVGALTFLAVAAGLFLYLRRRKEIKRNTFSSGRPYTEIDDPTRTEKFRSMVGHQTDRAMHGAAAVRTKIAGTGVSLKSKLIGPRSNAPNVNMNRGNSQFYEGSVLSQHSRTNSNSSAFTPEKPTMNERVADWWSVLLTRLPLRGKQQSIDLFPGPIGMREKDPLTKNSPPFSYLLGGDSNLSQSHAAHRRSLSIHSDIEAPVLPFGASGLNFGPDDPHTDAISRPRRSVLRQQTYTDEVRRSRGQSMDATSFRPVLRDSHVRQSSVGETPSRYPSGVTQRHDSYRDTAYSSFSTNVRRGKGRSDPFDLERPELWAAPPPQPALPTGFSISSRTPSEIGPRYGDQNPFGLEGLAENPLSRDGSLKTTRRHSAVSSMHSAMSEYSIGGLSFLGDYSGPGPAVGAKRSSSNYGPIDVDLDPGVRSVDYIPNGGRDIYGDETTSQSSASSLGRNVGKAV